jgi:hypothetical protein
VGSDMACRRPHAAIATMLGMGRSEIARFLEFAPTFNGLCGTGKTVRALLAEGAGGCARTADTARPARSRSDLGAISERSPFLYVGCGVRHGYPLVANCYNEL